MARFSFQAAEDVAVSNLVDEPCWVHAVVRSIEDGPTDDSGKMQEKLVVKATVYASTVASQVGRDLQISLPYPKLSSKDGGRFSLKKITRTFEAVDLTTPQQRGQEVNIEDLEIAKGRSFICEIERNEYQVEKGPRAGQTEIRYVLAFANIFHVDDPAVAKYPKHAGVMAATPKSLRHPPEYFKGNGSPTNLSTAAPADENSVDNL